MLEWFMALGDACHMNVNETLMNDENFVWWRKKDDRVGIYMNMNICWVCHDIQEWNVWKLRSI